MSLLDFKFLQRVPSPFVPVNAAAVAGDRIDDAIAKLQGQINARIPYSQTLSAGSSFTITHSLGNTDVKVDVRQLTGATDVLWSSAVVDANNVSLIFSRAVSASEFRVTVFV